MATNFGTKLTKTRPP